MGLKTHLARFLVTGDTILRYFHHLLSPAWLLNQGICVCLTGLQLFVHMSFCNNCNRMILFVKNEIRIWYLSLWFKYQLWYLYWKPTLFFGVTKKPVVFWIMLCCLCNIFYDLRQCSLSTFIGGQSYLWLHIWVVCWRLSCGRVLIPCFILFDL